VGIDRARLFQKKENKLRLRAHDMRAFFITAGMFPGRDALWITDRSGHTTLGMLRTYARAALRTGHRRAYRSCMSAKKPTTMNFAAVSEFSTDHIDEAEHEKRLNRPEAWLEKGSQLDSGASK
jgi:hypothetical protein